MDIDSDDELLAAYLERIPVVEVDGAIVSELELEPERPPGRPRTRTPLTGTLRA